MGFNTALMFCNDALGALKRDPDAGVKIASGITLANRDDSFGVGNHVNCFSVLPSIHANGTQVILVGGNTIRSVCTFGHTTFMSIPDCDIEEKLLARLADDLGYNLSKKAWRKRLDAPAISTQTKTSGSTQTDAPEQ
jgi:hypothetical protein